MEVGSEREAFSLKEVNFNKVMEREHLAASRQFYISEVKVWKRLYWGAINHQNYEE